MPTVETIRLLVSRNEGVAFLPRMCVEQDIAAGNLCEVRVKELDVDRHIRLVYPEKRVLSHAARAFLELIEESRGRTEGGVGVGVIFARFAKENYRRM